MCADIPDPDFEPQWLWATRVTAEAARAAMVKGRTPREHFEIYEQLILALCNERQREKTPEHSTTIAEATAPIPGNPVYNYLEVEERIMISSFADSDTIDPQ
jgi:hypothetical protein